jgi:heat shock protein HtpX
MSKPILTQARNIYEQQEHNRRMTWMLMLAFIFLIAAVGIGFDVFLNIGTLSRIIMLPFVLLMVASGMWNFRKKAIAGLWEKPKVFADDEGDLKIFRWIVILIIVPLVLLLFAPIFLINPRPYMKFLHSSLDIFFRFSNAPLVRYLPVGTVLSVCIGIFSILTSLKWGKNSVLWSMNAGQSFDGVPDLPQLIDVVKEISLAAGIRCPSVYVVKDSDPNSFTIGSNENDSCIVVTSGLLAILDRQELQGVIAHEISHIRNSDTRLMTVLTVLFGAVLLLSQWMKKSALVGGFTGSRIPGAGWVLRGVFFAGWLVTLLLAPLIARIVAMAVSRQREYLADAGCAELTRNPKALASALAKIENAADPTTSFQKGIAHLCVVDPLGKKINTQEGWWANLFATHPPLKNRIVLLNAMAYQSSQVPELAAR